MNILPQGECFTNQHQHLNSTLQLSLPVYVQVLKGDSNKKSSYRAQLLFYRNHASENVVLQRAMTKLSRSMRKLFSSLGKDWNQRGLVNMSFNPAGLRQTNVNFEFMLKSRYWRCKYFIATFPAFGRNIAFCPDLPDLWFEYERGELKARAAEVYEAYFRELYRQNEDRVLSLPPTIFNAESKRWLTWIDVRANIDQISEDENAKKMMALWTNSSANGEAELDRVGRCLDWHYPDDLDRSFCRDDEVILLRQLMEMPDQRPVMLVGDSLCGKTALVHEVVSRRVEDRQQRTETTNEKVDQSRDNVWLLAPQRLISGMSYVGQWEERVHAILKSAHKKNLTLYFDDPIGLFRAGKSSCSNLCVADLLRKPLQDRSVRVLCEMTNSGYEQLLNIDRSFADMFHVVRLDPLDEKQTMKVAIEVTRKIEREQKTDFGPDVIPTVIQLQRQYVAHACFPGKAVRFLKQLGVKYPKTRVESASVIVEMAETCGINLPLVDNNQTLARDAVSYQFQQQIVGQEAAVNACVDLVMTQKARLAQPGKPLMTMLFTGPTGVGKTETAKALANYLFGDSEKLVRFDLNEFKTGYSAARLVGTLDQPEGLLTSAIRHRPYSVILFDEIEKGHPDVFDILLQVLGEGRLTDAFGRTTDFSNTIIVMTSNLGAKRAGSTVGFIPTDDQRHYIAAAEKFFRPEFFNRIDRVVPFHSLNREQISSIADRLMQSVVSREGLMRRRCVLDVGPGLISDIVDVGYDEAMGARGLKRAIEHHFTHPVAAELACIRSTTPTLITVRKKAGVEVIAKRTNRGIHRVADEPDKETHKYDPPSGRVSHEMAGEGEVPSHKDVAEHAPAKPDGPPETTADSRLPQKKVGGRAADARGLDVDVLPLLNAEAAEQPRRFEEDSELVEAATQFLDRVEAESFSERPPGEITGSGMSPEILRYFTLVETANEIRETISALRSRSEKPVSSQPPALPVSQGRKSVADRERMSHDPRVYLQQIAAVDDIQDFVKQSAINDASGKDALHTKLIDECRLLAANAESSETEAIIFMSPSDPNLFTPGRLTPARAKDAHLAFEPYSFAFRAWLRKIEFENSTFDIEIDGKFTRCIHISGSGVMTIVGRENGYILRTLAEGRIGLLELGVVTPEHAQFSKLREAIQKRDASELSGDICLEWLRNDEPLRVLRVLNDTAGVGIDFRSGMKDIRAIVFDRIRSMHCASLPVPPEFRKEVSS